MRKKERFPKICKWCGKEFYLQRHRLERVTFCSNQCAAYFRYQHHEYKPKNCSQCGKEFHKKHGEAWSVWKKAKYCSALCFHESKKIDAVCSYCGNTINRKLSRLNGKRRFCSVGCRRALRRVSKKNGIQLRRKPHASAVRTGIYGTECAICGFDRCLDYAHLIPAREGGTVHKDNIVALCPNHHRLFDKGELNEEERRIIDARMEIALGSPFSRLDLTPKEIECPAVMSQCEASVYG